jgi:hypothetical protein
MKKSSKQLLAVAASLAAGAVIRTVLSPHKRTGSGKYQGDTWISKCSREKLQMIKGKLEMHKSRLENKIQKINSKLAEPVI